MIRVFNGDALAIQENDYNWRTALHYFLDGHHNDYVLIYRDDKPIKALSYHDVCYNRDVPEKVIYLDQDVFAEARKYFFTYETQEERWKRAVTVCNRAGEAECILYYQHNPIRIDYPVSEFQEYAFDESLDFDWLARGDLYIFEEYEEYTAFIYDVLERRFPEKRKYFLDENAQIFLGSDGICCVMPDSNSHLDHMVRVTSKRERESISEDPQPGIYSSLEIMTSLFWNAGIQHCGMLNPDKKFFLIQFPMHSSGLCDMIRFCLAKIAMTEYSKPEYIPVINLKVPGDTHHFSKNKSQNVWELFFEPLNDYSVKEVMTSQHVLVSSDKIDAFNLYIMEQFYNPQNMREVCKKYLRLNSEMKTYINKMRSRVMKTESKMLGVVARGTDYRYGGFDVPCPMDDDEFIELVKIKLKEWNCEYLLLATEDIGILEHFKQAGFGDKLKYIEQERYKYPDTNQPGILVSKMKRTDHDYHGEMPYLAILYLLADCNSLISNCQCGAFVVADYINGGMYEHRYCCGKGYCL